MRRIAVQDRRVDLDAALQKVGVSIVDCELDWRDGVAYEFSRSEVDRLYQAAKDIHQMSLLAVDAVVADDLFFRFGMSGDWALYAANSWKRQDKALIGRMDFIIDDSGVPKLLEYNGQTMGLTLEAAVVQDLWAETHGRLSVANTIEQELIEAWRAANLQEKLPDKLYFGSFAGESTYDFAQAEYLRYVAERAGFKGRSVDMQYVGHNGEQFVDEEDTPIQALYMHCPWDYVATTGLAEEAFKDKIPFFEPGWRSLLDNKALLPLLWERNENHPNLLPAFHSAAQLGREDGYVRKPLWGFGGDAIEIVDKVDGLSRDGEMGDEGHIFQEYCKSPSYDGNFPVVSVWVINDKPCAIGVREDRTRITGTTSNFVPHFIR